MSQLWQQPTGSEACRGPNDLGLTECTVHIVQGVYCTLYLGKQRAKTPTCSDLSNLGWNAFEFEFSIYEYCNKLSVPHNPMNTSLVHWNAFPGAQRRCSVGRTHTHCVAQRPKAV